MSEYVTFNTCNCGTANCNHNIVTSPTGTISYYLVTNPTGTSYQSARYQALKNNEPQSKTISEMLTDLALK